MRNFGFFLKFSTHQGKFTVSESRKFGFFSHNSFLSSRKLSIGFKEFWIFFFANFLSLGKVSKTSRGGGVYQFCALLALDADPPHFRPIPSGPPPKCRYSVYTPPKSTAREKILRRNFFETTPKKQKNCKYTL